MSIMFKVSDNAHIFFYTEYKVLFGNYAITDIGVIMYQALFWINKIRAY